MAVAALKTGVLASIDQADAQQALINGALQSNDGSQQISLMDFAASSVRRFGDLATDRQAADLKRFLTTARGQVAEAAARLYGSMNRHGTTKASPTATTQAGT